MWLARLFGGRKVTQNLQPVKRSTSTGRPQAAKAKAKSGFDPYNSGSFERGNAWERVVRR